MRVLANINYVKRKGKETGPEQFIPPIQSTFILLSDYTKLLGILNLGNVYVHYDTFVVFDICVCF